MFFGIGYPDCTSAGIFQVIDSKRIVLAFPRPCAGTGTALPLLRRRASRFACIPV